MPASKDIQKLDFNLLKIFESLYVERNMSATARALFITPSAVSHAVKRLRNTLNDPLFVRQGQQMKPTPACERMAPQLIDTLTRLKQILQQCGEFSPETTEQTFKIAIHDALEPLIIPVLVNQIAPLVPKANLTSVALNRELLARQLSSGEVDLAIDIARPMKSPIQHSKLSQDDFCVLASSTHVEAISRRQYLASQHIVVSSRPSGRVIEDFALLQQGINRDIRIRCQSYQAAVDIVEQSALLLTLPKLIASKYLSERTVMFSLPVSIPASETHLYWHEHTVENEALSWMRSQITSVLY
ncbi:LysR substrate-binding domain-containing protein [Thalassotalea euphylliae]|uniref:LysR family transcriptional regulator n=1 Tax=Thalassotalea euphylliae TaxID=1655234 RepID=UPI00363F67CE